MMMQTWLRWLPALGLGVLAACSGNSDSSLGHTFVPNPDGDSDNYGNPSKIAAGTTRWYQYTGIYKPSFSNGQGGATENEKQRMGHLCIRVDEVRDTESANYEDATETVLVSRVRVSGAGTNEVYIQDLSVGEGGTPDPAVVDQAVSNLWISKLTVPSVNHGYTTPAQAQFHTREAFCPPEQSLLSLPFFDVRVASIKTWGGWDFYDAECSNYNQQEACEAAFCDWRSGNYCESRAKNYVGQVLGYFYGAAVECSPNGGSNKCKISYSQQQSNCSSYADQAACNSHSCTWTNASCVGRYQFEIFWRETITTGPEELVAIGNVVHYLLIAFDDSGALDHATEYIGPDLDTAAELPATSGGICIADQPCMQGTIENYNERPFSEAYCTF